MHVSGTRPHLTPPQSSVSGRAFWIPVLLTFAVVFGLLIISGLTDIHPGFIGPDGDDSMRLVQIRDWLSGQAWFDTTQYRLGQEGGTLMHWSRIVDLPIAALIVFFDLFLPSQIAENAALIIWPPLTALAVIAGLAKAASYLGGQKAMIFALLLSVIYLLLHPRFLPGAIDHHNMQLGLLAIAAGLLLDPNHRMKTRIGAAIAIALATGVGVEVYLIIILFIAYVVLTWIVLGDVVARATAAFAGVLAACVALLFLATTPPALYNSAFCDGLFTPIASLLFLGALGLAGLGLVTPKSWLVRGALAGGLGLALLVFAKVSAPQCLGNPLDQLDPLIHEFWLSKVQEAVGAMEEFRDTPAFVPHALMVPALGVLVCAYKLIRTQFKFQYGLLLSLLLLNLAMTFYQVRFAVFGNMFGIIPLAVVAGNLRTRSQAEATPSAMLKFYGFLALCLPMLWSLAVMGADNAFNLFPNKAPDDVPADVSISCDSDAVMAALDNLPTGRFAAEINASIPILEKTRHSVLVGNYHRGADSLLLQIKAFSAHPADGITQLRDAKIDYVLMCETDGAWAHMRQKYPNGFWAQLYNGADMAGLERKYEDEAHEAIRVYEIYPKYGAVPKG